METADATARCDIPFHFSTSITECELEEVSKRVERMEM